MAGFAPKTEVKLDPPKDDPITVEELAQCDGEHEGKPIYVAIKGRLRSALSAQAAGRTGLPEADRLLCLQAPSLTSLPRKTCMDQVQAIMQVV